MLVMLLWPITGQQDSRTTEICSLCAAAWHDVFCQIHCKASHKQPVCLSFYWTNSRMEDRGCFVMIYVCMHTSCIQGGIITINENKSAVSLYKHHPCTNLLCRSSSTTNWHHIFTYISGVQNQKGDEIGQTTGTQHVSVSTLCWGWLFKQQGTQICAFLLDACTLANCSLFVC